MKRFKLLGPLGLLIGTIIGVGMFGLPYVGYHAGLLTLVISFAVAVGLLYVISEAYGRIIIGTSGRHRLPGYVEKYLGYNWKQAALLTVTVGIWGSILSYVLVGGEFLSNLFEPLIGGSPLFYSLAFFSLGAWLIHRDARMIARAEVVLMSLFVVMTAVFVIFGWPKIDWPALKLFSRTNLLLPYGVTLFALWGINVLPDVSELVAAQHRLLRRVTIISLLTATVIYLIFTVVIVGISGSGVTGDALGGLTGVIAQKILLVGYLFGVIATFTSYIGLGLDLKKVFMYDYGQHALIATLLTCLVPLALFLGGLKNFISVISVVGGVILGLEGILILSMYVTFARRQRRLLGGPLPKLVPLARFSAVIFALGVVIGLLTPWLLKNI